MLKILKKCDACRYIADFLASHILKNTTITYDAIGNLLSYDGQTFTWLGRRMLSYTKPGTTAAYQYNADGIRTTKTVGSTTTKYFLNGSTILAQQTGSNTIPFYYDANGKRIAFKYNGDMYYYVYNLQGDVTHIMKSDKTIAGTYQYDAWGKILNLNSLTAIAKVNPFRYRGYYYDTESNLYYVGSRYYDPEIGRWISPEPNVYAGDFDESAGILGYNVYAYCANNPVNFFDPTGEFIISTLLICVVAGAVIGGTVGGFAGNAYANSRGYTGWDKTKCILTGIGVGGFAGGAAGYFAAPLVVSATGVAGISVTSAGISTVAAVGTSFGKLGTLIVNNGQQIIDWGKSTWHGIQRMAERGVTQGRAEAWVKTGKALQQAGGKILYITQQGAVVVNKSGQVITAYTSQYFDANMWEVVKKLFGK